MGKAKDENLLRACFFQYPRGFRGAGAGGNDIVNEKHGFTPQLAIRSERAGYVGAPLLRGEAVLTFRKAVAAQKLFQREIQRGGKTRGNLFRLIEAVFPLCRFSSGDKGDNGAVDSLLLPIPLLNQRAKNRSQLGVVQFLPEKNEFFGFVALIGKKACHGIRIAVAAVGKKELRFKGFFQCLFTSRAKESIAHLAAGGAFGRIEKEKKSSRKRRLQI